MLSQLSTDFSRELTAEMLVPTPDNKYFNFYEKYFNKISGKPALQMVQEFFSKEVSGGRRPVSDITDGASDKAGLAFIADNVTWKIFQF